MSSDAAGWLILYLRLHETEKQAKQKKKKKKNKFNRNFVYTHTLVPQLGNMMYNQDIQWINVSLTLDKMYAKSRNA